MASSGAFVDHRYCYPMDFITPDGPGRCFPARSVAPSGFRPLRKIPDCSAP